MASVNIEGRLKALLGGGVNKAKGGKEMGIRNSKTGERTELPKVRSWAGASPPVNSGAFHVQMQV